MTETNFTPGPWKTSKGSFLYQININTEADTLATVYGEGGENWANARLIAAAPELYELLKRARYAAEDDYACGEDLLEEIDAVLAKARGEA